MPKIDEAWVNPFGSRFFAKKRKSEAFSNYFAKKRLPKPGGFEEASESHFRKCETFPLKTLARVKNRGGEPRVPPTPPSSDAEDRAKPCLQRMTE